MSSRQRLLDEYTNVPLEQFNRVTINVSRICKKVNSLRAEWIEAKFPASPRLGKAGRRRQVLYFLRDRRPSNATPFPFSRKQRAPDGTKLELINVLFDAKSKTRRRAKRREADGKVTSSATLVRDEQRFSSVSWNNESPNAVAGRGWKRSQWQTGEPCPGNYCYSTCQTVRVTRGCETSWI